MSEISIHALVKRATLALKDTSKKYVYFNPRPRKEGDPHFGKLIVNLKISIHALVKRATKNCHFYPNHMQDFNPRPRKEGDSKGLFQSNLITISIHALVKRATDDFINQVIRLFEFQSTPS